MKKTILSIILIALQFLSFGGVTFAHKYVDEKGQLGEGMILVSEKPLGAKSCKCAQLTDNGTKVKLAGDKEENGEVIKCSTAVAKRLYVCEQTGLMEMIQGIVRYIIQISLLLGVLATAILGVAWAIAGGDDPEYKKKLKEWLIGLIIGLILIYGFQYILGIFGWIYKSTI